MRTPRPELMALLQTAREAGDDPTPLLVVADWLEEHGDEIDRDRAELGRLAVTLRCWENTSAQEARRARHDELVSRHSERWLGPFLNAKAEAALFSGMVVGSLSARAVLAAEASGAHLTEEWAWFRYARFRCAERDSARVAASPVLGSVPNIHLEASGAGTLTTLLGSPHLLSIRSLSLGNTKLDDTGVTALAASPNLRNLRELGLSHTRFGDGGLEALAAAKHLRQLRKLNLEKVRFARLGIGPAGVAALARSQAFPSLTELDLGSNRVGNEGAEALASGPLLRPLEWLRLLACEIGTTGITALCKSRHIGGLKKLIIGHNTVGLAGAEAIAADPPAAFFPEAWLNSCALNDRAIECLAGSARFREVGLLHLESNKKITDAAASAVAAQQWPNLTRITLWGTRCTEEARRILMNAPGLKKLKQVDR
jgi:uncharacterized protein (TIGR02996 family)